MRILLLALVGILAVPVAHGIYRDGNWVGPNDDGTSPAEWAELDAQHVRYSEAKEAGHEWLSKGDYKQAHGFFVLAAENAIWSWTQAWSLNNAAYALVLSVNHDDGLSGAEVKDLEEAASLYSLALESLETADDVGARPEQIKACRAKVTKSLDSVSVTLGRKVSK